MYDNDKYINLIKQRLSDYRFHHSMCVAERAKQLAHIHGADEEKAYTAGILHDIMKEESNEIQIAEAEKAGIVMSRSDLENPRVFHQISGAAYVKNNLSLDDDIISAIRYHTTGRENMTLLEIIVYLADFTSEDRQYPDVDVMRNLSEQNIFEAMLYSLCYTITDIVRQKRCLHPDTLYCYNWVVGQINKNREG